MIILVSNDKVCYDINAISCVEVCSEEQQHIFNGVPKPFSFVHMFYKLLCLLYDLLPSVW